jgi:hypothetical protein
MRGRIFWLNDSMETTGIIPHGGVSWYSCVGVGSYTFMGGYYKGETTALGTYNCYECGGPIFAEVQIESPILRGKCMECEHETFIISSMETQLNEDLYGDLIISNIKDLHLALCNSLVISIVNTLRFLNENVIISEQGRDRHKKAFLEHIDRILSVSIFRNDNSLHKVEMALNALVSGEEKSMDISDKCLLCVSNITKALEKLKVENINIFTGEEDGIERKMVLVTTDIMPLFLPYELFEETFMDKLMDLKGTKLKETKGISKLAIFPKTKLGSMAKVSTVCPGCGSAIEEEDVKAKKCLQCKMRIRVGPLTKKKVTKKKVSRKKLEIEKKLEELLSD